MLDGHRDTGRRPRRYRWAPGRLMLGLGILAFGLSVTGHETAVARVLAAIGIVGLGLVLRGRPRRRPRATGVRVPAPPATRVPTTS